MRPINQVAVSKGGVNLREQTVWGILLVPKMRVKITDKLTKYK